MKADSIIANDSLPVKKIWWFLIALVAIYGFGILITITSKAYRDKPPIPDRVIDSKGDILFTSDDINEGQNVFLNHGLQDNGTVWGHGGYLGPDYPALYLHRLSEKAQKRYGVKNAADSLKTNRYDSATRTLTFTDVEKEEFESEPAMWKEFFSRPDNNGGLSTALITDPAELRQLTAYFSWMAWASVAARPGESYSYTNNFPYDPTVGNIPSADTYIWSVASLIFLLCGIGATLFVYGSNRKLGWKTPERPLTPMVIDGQPSPSQRSLVKFVVVVAGMFLVQTLVGGLVAHYRSDPGSFFGIDLNNIFSSQLVRGWHLQLAIFWIATGFVAGGLFVSRAWGGKEPRYQRTWTNILWVAFLIVIGGSLLMQWASSLGWIRNPLEFWIGDQGWEYLELGRVWQYLLIAGLAIWFVLVVRNAKPALKKPGLKKLTVYLLVAAFAIPFFYVPAIFFDNMTHYTVVDTWRFWIIHLWVEGFFELFATVMVALILVELGVVTRRNALTVCLLDTVLIFMGGVIGTGHHWYFSGQTDFNMAMAGCFSALEVVPLILLALEGWSYMRYADKNVSTAGYRHRWTLRFLMSVGFWNFLGAGVFGFLINMPIVSFFETGTYLTPNHGHAAMFGVFGLLAISLCVYILRETLSAERWAVVERYVKVSFWGLNIGLALMLALSLLPTGFVQLADVARNGYWHARSMEFTGSPLMVALGWARMPADIIFILFGAVPLFIGSVAAWIKQK